MRLRALMICSGILLCMSMAHAQGKAPDVVKYHATLETVKYVYGVAPPVARLAPGDVLETNTLDAFGDAIQKPGDTLALVKGDNPLTGPFFIEGAEPGDTIAIDFMALEVNSSHGVGAFAPGFGALNSTNYTPMIQAPLPERIWLRCITTTTPRLSRRMTRISR
jgi:amidase